MKKYLLLTVLCTFLIEFILQTATDYIPRKSSVGLFAVVTVIMLILPAVYAAVAYYQLRKAKVNKQAEVIAVTGTTVGVVVAGLLGMLTFQHWIAHETPASGAGIVSSTIISLIATFLLCLVGAAIARYFYRRRHSIITN